MIAVYMGSVLFLYFFKCQSNIVCCLVCSLLQSSCFPMALPISLNNLCSFVHLCVDGSDPGNTSVMKLF